MAMIRVTTRAGAVLNIKAQAGMSVMENIRNADIEEMVALCGGTMSCATCHVYVDELFVAQLIPPSNDETAMLEVAENPKPNSRLSCQVQFTEALDGLAVTLAPSS